LPQLKDPACLYESYPRDCFLSPFLTKFISQTGTQKISRRRFETEGQFLGKPSCLLSFCVIFRVRSFEVIRIWISVPTEDRLGTWFIKGTDESTLVTDSSVPLMHHDPSDLGSLIRIQIIPKERILSYTVVSLS